MANSVIAMERGDDQPLKYLLDIDFIQINETN